MMKNIGIFLNIETTSRRPVATGNLEYNERIYYCLFNSDITGGRRQNIVLINEEGVPIYGPVDKSAIGYSMELRPMALRVLRRLTPGCFRVVRSFTIRFRFNAVAERRQCS